MNSQALERIKLEKPANLLFYKPMTLASKDIMIKKI